MSQIGHHLMNPEEPPLFDKVIMESGAPTARAVYPPTHPLHENQFREFLVLTGATTLPEEQVMEYLRALPVTTIKIASEMIYNRYNPSIRWPFQPVIDGPGGVIPVAPIEAWRSGNWHKVPILTGFNTNEGAMFVPKEMSTSAEFIEFFHNLIPGLSPDDLNYLNDLYPDPTNDTTSPYVETRLGVGPQYKRVEAAYAHFAYIAPTRHTANFASSKPEYPPVYLYHFASNRSVVGGANHGDQNEYVSYNQDPVVFSPTQKAIAGEMHAYWTSFIATGDPNAVKEGEYADRRPWPRYGRDPSAALSSGAKMVFGLGSDERAGGVNTGQVASLKADLWAETECNFWWSKVHVTEQLPPPAMRRSML